MARGFFDGCSFSDTLGLFFRAFGLNTEIFRVSLFIQLECGNIQTRNTPNTDTFHTVIFLFLAHIITFVMSSAIWYHLYNFKKVKNTHGGMLILVNLQAEPCNFTKINTPPWVFFTFFKLYKWYQIAQRTTFMLLLISLYSRPIPNVSVPITPILFIVVPYVLILVTSICRPNALILDISRKRVKLIN